MTMLTMASRDSNDPLGHRCRSAASKALRYAKGAESLAKDGGRDTPAWQEWRDKAVHYAQIAEGSSVAAGGLTAMIRELYLGEECTGYPFDVDRVQPKRTDPRGAKLQYDWALALKLYKEGAHDIEIANRIGTSRKTVSSWRIRNGLPVNAQRKVKTVG